MTEFLSSFWLVFSFSFLVALTGALSPGPLFTYTIIKSAKSEKRGWLVGLWVIAGHAVIETAIIIVLLSGFSYVLQDTVVVRAIGIIGGLLLVWFGFSIIRDVYLGKIPTDFLDASENTTEVVENGDPAKNKWIENPVVGGILVSMANPYWWVWWATIGLAFMIQFDVSFKEWPKLIAFFLGHEAGDLIWYLIVSTLAFFGLRKLNRRAYYGILAFCGLFMIGFGLYLGISSQFGVKMG